MPYNWIPFSIPLLVFSLPFLSLYFLLGYLIGYLAHRRKEEAPSFAVSTLDPIIQISSETVVAPLMDWDVVKSLLGQKLSPGGFEDTFRLLRYKTLTQQLLSVCVVTHLLSFPESCTIWEKLGLMQEVI